MVTMRPQNGNMYYQDVTNGAVVEKLVKEELSPEFRQELTMGKTGPMCTHGEKVVLRCLDNAATVASKENDNDRVLLLRSLKLICRCV